MLYLFVLEFRLIYVLFDVKRECRLFIYYLFASQLRVLAHGGAVFT